MLEISRLREYLSRLEPGAIQDVAAVERLVANCWNKVQGSAERGMAEYKVLGRMENVDWDPPAHLSFTIERHGGTVLGSTRAELQRWRLDVETLSAECGEIGRRQLRPMQPRLKVEPIADELTEVITNGREDSRLRWYGARRVRILIGSMIPAGSAVQATLVGRRKRLGRALEQRLVAAGWSKTVGAAPHTYELRSQ